MTARVFTINDWHKAERRRDRVRREAIQKRHAENRRQTLDELLYRQPDGGGAA